MTETQSTPQSADYHLPFVAFDVAVVEVDVVPGSVLTLTAADADAEEEEDDDESEEAGGDFSFDLPVETEAKRRNSISLLSKIQIYI